MKPVMISLETVREIHPQFNHDDTVFPLSDALPVIGIRDTLRLVTSVEPIIKKFAWWCVKQAAQQVGNDRALGYLDVIERYNDGNATMPELMETCTAAETAAVTYTDYAAAYAVYTTWTGAANTAAYAAAYAANTAADLEAQTAKLQQALDAGEWINDEVTE